MNKPKQKPLPGATDELDRHPLSARAIADSELSSMLGRFRHDYYVRQYGEQKPKIVPFDPQNRYIEESVSTR